MAHNCREQRGDVDQEQKIMPVKSQRRKCMRFLWDERLTIKAGTGENNMSGISERMKESETNEGNEGDGFVGVAALCYVTSREVM